MMIEPEIIHSLHASAGISGTKHVPVRNWDRAELVLKTFEDLGLAVPTGVKIAAAQNSPLGPFKIYVHDLDAKLKQTTLNTTQKIMLKAAAGRHDLLRTMK
jgi:hypothetical protein